MRKTVFLFCCFLVVSPLTIFPQQRLPLNAAITQSGNYIENQLPGGARILLCPINSAFGELADFIADEVTAQCISSRYLTVLERNRDILQTIEQETSYQLSGEVSDETAVSIGKKLGTEYLVFFVIRHIGDRYILNVRITGIEQGEIKGQQNIILEPDPVLLNLVSKSSANIPKRTLAINDTRKILISGYEIIETGNRELLNKTTTTRGEFRNVSIDNNLAEVRFSLPNIFSAIDQINLDDAIDYVLNNKNVFPVQYALLFVSRTNIVKGGDRYNIPNRLVASCNFVLIDFYSEQIVYSDTVDTNGYLFELADLNETTIVNESTKAFKYLFNKNNNQNIGTMISDMLGKL